MHVIVANFSDDSVALIQWAYEQSLTDLKILTVDTGFGADNWHKRIDLIKNWLIKLNIPMYTLEPNASFKQLIIDRKQFPSQRFQWCPGLLKGMPILNWLEKNDQEEKATILLPHRKSMSKAQSLLEEYEYNSQYYDDRTVWYPLYKHLKTECDSLVKKSTIPFINHRSLECQPCIFSSKRDLITLSDEDINKIDQLEKEIGQPMFNPKDHHNNQSIKAIVNELQRHPSQIDDSENYYDIFAKGCGWPYACGL